MPHEPHAASFQPATIKRIQLWLKRLESDFYEDWQPLGIQYVRDDNPIPFGQLRGRKFRALREGQQWGKSWDSAWFKFRGTIPRKWNGRAVAAVIRLSGEGCVFDSKGTPLLALTPGSIFDTSYIRDRVEITPRAKGGEKVNLLVEAAANNLFGIAAAPDPSPKAPDRNDGWKAVLHKASLAVFRPDIRGLFLQAQFLFYLFEALPEGNYRRAQLLPALNDAANAYQPEEGAVGRAAACLAPELARRAGDSALRTIAVGHAHLDILWLWPMRETIRKAGRTFATQVDLLGKYPDYVFGMSQPQLYQLVKDNYPALYTKVKDAVRKGRLEPLGAMWVEPDCNIPGGEALVRQLLYGQLFWEREFGLTVRNMWTPDVFGFSASLPQILKQAGVDSFVSIKISRSKVNQFPHHTFQWKGIDGSTVLAHFPPENNYGSQLNPKPFGYSDGLVKAQNNFRESGFLDYFLTIFGEGDGGGGPADHLVQRGRMARNLDGLPKVQFGKAGDLLDILHEHRDELATWDGELYLEDHRGVLTSQTWIKKENRQCESLLRDAEIWWSHLPLNEYPHAELLRHWRTLLLNQFHDVLPGTSIHTVYKEALEQYARMTGGLLGLNLIATSRLAEQCPRKSPKGRSVLLFNSLSHARRDPVSLVGPLPAAAALVGEDGTSYPVQKVARGHIAALPANALGITAYRVTSDRRAAANPLSVGTRRLENQLLCVEFSSDGTIRSIWDKEQQREVLAAGKTGNELVLYDDTSNAAEAWNIEHFYRQKRLAGADLLSTKVVERGPVRAAVQFRYAIGHSTISQTVSLATASRALTFATQVDWCETHKMLRVQFPVDIRAAEAAYEVQFGYYKRPTHVNTSWEAARFEVCGHRYVDLSEPDYGVSLLNDCKYGHRVVGNVLELNLLRAPKEPDPFADQGTHEFTYALYPHPGGLAERGTVQAAAELNSPWDAVVRDGEYGSLPGLLSLAGDGVVCEAIKKSEREECLIVRLYESLGRHCRAQVTINHNGPRVFATDLLEKRQTTVPVNNQIAQLDFKPFEIKTLKIKFGSRSNGRITR